MTDQSATPLIGVVVLGDGATTAQHAQLNGVAEAHGHTIKHHSTFPVGSLTRAADLTSHNAVIDAGAKAVTLGCPVWVPFPTDLGCEDNIRRLHLGLRSAGVTVLVGPDFHLLGDETALSPLDKALRVEIAHVQDLTAAVTASAAIKPLLGEITAELAAEPALPEPALHCPVDWVEHLAELQTYARSLAASGMTQAEIATHLNELGHRTKRGRMWSQAQVSHLLKGHHRAGGNGLAA